MKLWYFSLIIAQSEIKQTKKDGYFHKLLAYHHRLFYKFINLSKLGLENQIFLIIKNWD